MNKKELEKLVAILKEAGFKDLVKYDKKGRATYYELGHIITKFSKRMRK